MRVQRKDVNLEWICGKGDICTDILGIDMIQKWIWHDNGKKILEKLNTLISSREV